MSLDAGGARSDDAFAGRLGMAWLAIFVLLWALLEEVVGIRLEGSYNLMQVVWSRYCAHLLLMIALFGWSRPSRLWQSERRLFQLSRSMMMLVMPASFTLAVQYYGIHPATVWGVFWVSPVLIIVIAQWFLREQVPMWVWVLALVGSLTAAVMLTRLEGVSPVEMVLPAAMAISFSVYVAMTRSLRGETLHANLFYTAVGVFAVLSPLMPAIWIWPSLHDVAILGAVGAVGFVALLALDRAASVAPVSRAASTLYLHLVFVAGIGWLHGGGLGRAALGGSIVITVISLVMWIGQPVLAGRDDASLGRWKEYAS